MRKTLIEKMDNILTGRCDGVEMEISNDDYMFVLDIDDAFAAGESVSADEVEAVNLIWESYYG